MSSQAINYVAVNWSYGYAPLLGNPPAGLGADIEVDTLYEIQNRNTGDKDELLIYQGEISSVAESDKAAKSLMPNETAIISQESTKASDVIHIRWPAGNGKASISVVPK